MSEVGHQQLEKPAAEIQIQKQERTEQILSKARKVRSQGVFTEALKHLVAAYKANPRNESVRNEIAEFSREVSHLQEITLKLLNHFLVLAY